MQAVASAAEPPGFEARLTDLAEPRPQDDEVVVEVRATALNRADLLQLRGLYPPPPGEPESPGLECAGEILEIGAEVRGWRIGDRVMALLGGGGHAERVAVPAGQLLPVPVSFSWVEAAALPEAALTAWMATGRSLDRLEELWRRGADHLLADDDELPERLRLATGRGADLVFDTVSGGRLPSHLSALADQGRLVLVGLMAGARVEVDLAQLLRRRLRVIGSVLRSRPRLEKAQLIAAYAEFAADRMADGRLRPLIAKVVPFDRIAEAYAAMESGGLLGKIVVERSSG
jgi:NADPH:quinone reductase-like Zn-dependent oxidoreductase